MGAKGIGFDPRSFPDLMCWYKFADKSTVTLETGISQLLDLSGNGFDLSQSTASLQPAYLQDGYWKGYFHFDEITCVVPTNHYPELSLYLVVQSKATQINYSSLFSSGYSNGTVGNFQIDYVNDKVRVKIGSLGDMPIETSPSKDLMVLEVHYDNDTHRLSSYINNVAKASKSYTWTGGVEFDRIKLGTSRALNRRVVADIKEVICYTKHVTPREYICNRLMEDYNIS